MEISTPQIETMRAQVAQLEIELAGAKDQRAQIGGQFVAAQEQEDLLFNRVKCGLDDVVSLRSATTDRESFARLTRELDGEIEQSSGDLIALQSELSELVLIEELRELSRITNQRADEFNAARLQAAAVLLSSLQAMKEAEAVYRGVQSQIAAVARPWINAQPAAETLTAYQTQVAYASDLFATVNDDGTDTRNSRLALPHNQMFAGRLPMSNEISHFLLSDLTQIYLEKASII